MDNENITVVSPSPDDYFKQDIKRLFEIVDMSALIYDVREREGMGWNGPKVTEFAAIVQRIEKYLK